MKLKQLILAVALVVAASATFAARVMDGPIPPCNPWGCPPPQPDCTIDPSLCQVA